MPLPLGMQATALGRMRLSPIAHHGDIIMTTFPRRHTKAGKIEIDFVS